MEKNLLYDDGFYICYGFFFWQQQVRQEKNDERKIEETTKANIYL